MARTGSLGWIAIRTGKSPSRVCRPAGFSDQPLGRRTVPAGVIPGQVVPWRVRDPGPAWAASGSWARPPRRQARRQCPAREDSQAEITAIGAMHGRFPREHGKEAAGAAIPDLEKFKVPRGISPGHSGWQSSRILQRPGPIGPGRSNAVLLHGVHLVLHLVEKLPEPRPPLDTSSRRVVRNEMRRMCDEMGLGRFDGPVLELTQELEQLGDLLTWTSGVCRTMREMLRKKEVMVPILLSASVCLSGPACS